MGKLLQWSAGLAVAFFTAMTAAQSNEAPRTAAEREAIDRAIRNRIDQGADPVADADRAARAGNFRLIAVDRFLPRPNGITCLTPYGQPPELLAHIRIGDVVDERTGAFLRYAGIYNQTLVERPDFPDAELCRVSTQEDMSKRRSNFAITTPAQKPSRPARTLHEAARRGDATDVRKLLAQANPNALDGMGMTPLAWAVARDNKPAVDVLLEAKVNPWVAGERGQGAVFWAAQLGRRAYFERMKLLLGRPFKRWTAMHLVGAAAGGDAGILAYMLDQPHERFRFEILEALPSAEIAKLLLDDDPSLANTLLWESADYGADRPDLLALALAHGADPNTEGSGGRYGTPLGAFANGISPTSLESVSILLKAGADPNKMSHGRTPVSIAIGGLKLDDKINDHDARATAVLDALLAAGADLNRADDDAGVPAGWRLLFPYHRQPEKLDASYVTPALIEMLVNRGLDLNAKWQGMRVLSRVEAQAGTDSELAATLRRLGAQH